MAKFPVDAPKGKVIRTFESFGFHVVREGNHIAMVRENPDGTRTPLTIAEASDDKRLNVANDTDANRNIKR